MRKREQKWHNWAELGSAQWNTASESSLEGALVVSVTICGSFWKGFEMVRRARLGNGQLS